MWNVFYSFSNRYLKVQILTERCVRIISNSRGQSISSEANSSSSSQESTRILQRPILHCRIQIIPVLARSTQYTSPPIDSIKTDFNVILQSILMFFKWSFYHQISSPEHRIYLSLPLRAVCLAHFILLGLSKLFSRKY